MHLGNPFAYEHVLLEMSDSLFEKSKKEKEGAGTLSKVCAVENASVYIYIRRSIRIYNMYQTVNDLMKLCCVLLSQMGTIQNKNIHR